MSDSASLNEKRTGKTRACENVGQLDDGCTGILPEWLNEENAPTDQDEIWMRNARYHYGFFRSDSERRSVMRKRALVRVSKPVFWLALICGPAAAAVLQHPPAEFALPVVALDGAIWTFVLVAIALKLDTQTFPLSQPVTNELLQQACREIVRANLLAKASPTLPATYIKIASEDPALALAGLRMQIEKRLRVLARKKSIVLENLADILYDLRGQKVLNNEQYRALSSLRRIMNWAVHGDPVDQRAANFIHDIGPRLVARLDELIASN